MGTTNFTSILGVQSAGTGDVDKLAQSFDKLSTSIDAATSKATQLSSHPGFDDLASKIKQGIQDPMGAAGDAVESLMQKMGPMGTAVAAGFGIFTAAAAGAFEAAKSLGSYATSIENVSIRTGLSTKEVGLFSFAARVAGQDVSVFERAMRTLSQGLEGNTEKGKVARQGLADLGVTVNDMYGKARPMADVFMQISSGLSGISDPAKRDAEAIAIFGRAGIELLPTLLSLKDNLKLGESLGLGLPQAEIDKWREYQKQIAATEEVWNQFKRSAMTPIAATISFAYKGVEVANTLWSMFQGGGFNTKPTAADTEMGETEGWGYGAARSLRGHRADRRDISANDATVAAAGLPDDASKELETAKKKLEELLGELKTGVLPSVNAAVMAQINQQKGLIQNLKDEAEARKESVKGFIFFDPERAMIEGSKAYLDRDNKATADYLKGGNTLLHDRFGGFSPLVGDDIASAFDPQLAASSARRMFARKPDTEQASELLRDYHDQINPDPKKIEDDRDTARRSLGLFSASANLAGTPQAQQAYQQEALRKQFADRELADMRAIADAKALDYSNDDQRIAAEAEAKKIRAQAEEQNDQQYFDARMEREQSLIQLAVQQKEGFQNLATGAFQSLVSGARSRQGAGPALEKYLENQLIGLADKVVGNGAGAIWGDVSKLIPHANGVGIFGKLLQGTAFGPDATKQATVDNTLATIDNTNALRSVSMGGSGTGGPGGGGGLFTGGSAAGGGIFFNGDTGSPSSSGGDGGSVGDYNLTSLTDPAAYGMHTVSQTAFTGASSGLSLGNGIGIGTSLAAGGFGIYSGIQAGGTQGDLEAAGSAAGMLGGVASQLGKLSSTLSSTLGPIGMAIGAGLGIASLFLGDPKQNRATAETNTAVAARFTAPTPTNYTVDRYGDSSFQTMNGGFQPIQVTMQVQTLDANSFNENASLLANSLSTAIEGNLSPRFATAIRNVVNPQ